MRQYASHVGRAVTFDDARSAYDTYVLDTLIPTFTSAFTTQPLGLAGGLGFCDKDLNKGPAAGHYHPRLKYQFTTARERFGGYNLGTSAQRGFFIQYNGLNASPDGPGGFTKWVGSNFNPVDGAVSRGTVGFQFIGCVTGFCSSGQLLDPTEFPPTIENATLYDASYIEIYEKVLGPAIRPDLYAPELRAQATEFQQALTEFYPRLRSTVTGR